MGNAKVTPGTAAAHHAAYLVERLVQFGVHHGLLEPLDVYATRNGLLDLLRLDAPYGGELREPAAESAATLLEPLLDYAASAGILEENNATCRDLLDARIMGNMMPRQSELARQFWDKAAREGVEQATAYFYRLCIAANYIRMDRIGRNMYWLAETEYGELEITVNLSKPEKDPKEIAMLKNAPASDYPSCLLCIDNVGYAGRLNHPARQNLRVIPLKLGGEPWFFQYSPYVYYNEHCIVFDREHRPMKTSAHTFGKLFDFLDQFPHYFIGANADLPIVGGSILNHDHFQGGRHRFPMEKAQAEFSFPHPQYPDVAAGIVKWPMSVIRLSSASREPLLELAGQLLEQWREYSDPGYGLVAYTEENGQRTPHHTVTPIARKNQAGHYELDLVLRSNLTSEQHPDGVFHPHQPLHHIKKENIGLIEVMGLAVLPGRLKEELAQLAGILSGEAVTGSEMANDPGHPLNKHLPWLEELIGRYGTSMRKEEAERAVLQETGRKFADVLKDAGVYKHNDRGRAAFVRFLTSAGFQV